MSRRNERQFLKEGWKPHGPGKCKCPRCGAITSTNAMARARHFCAPRPEAPRAPRPDEEDQRDR
jgi:hypothetical protein